MQRFHNAEVLVNEEVGNGVIVSQKAYFHQNASEEFFAGSWVEREAFIKAMLFTQLIFTTSLLLWSQAKDSNKNPVTKTKFKEEINFKDMEKNVLY